MAGRVVARKQRIASFIVGSVNRTVRSSCTGNTIGADLGVPMIAWANVGHGGYFQTFPIGIAAELDADSATLRLLDPPLVPAGPG